MKNHAANTSWQGLCYVTLYFECQTFTIVIEWRMTNIQLTSQSQSDSIFQNIALHNQTLQKDRNE